MAQGTVKWYDTNIGYGFIMTDDDGPDVYVSSSTLMWSGIDKLNEQQRVFYEVKTSKTGRSAATSIRILDQAEA
jgi:cold shock protein